MVIPRNEVIFEKKNVDIWKTFIHKQVCTCVPIQQCPLMSDSGLGNIKSVTINEKNFVIAK